MLNWITWNINVFYIEIVLTMNWIGLKENCFDIYIYVNTIYTYAKLNLLNKNCLTKLNSLK